MPGNDLPKSGRRIAPLLVLTSVPVVPVVQRCTAYLYKRLHRCTHISGKVQLHHRCTDFAPLHSSSGRIWYTPSLPRVKNYSAGGNEVLGDQD